jgi:hypothetical protein
MVLLSRPTRYQSFPPSFRLFVHDSLLAMGLPYGPQAREQMALTYPDLFGYSRSTLRGYERWLGRTASSDTVDAFTRFMDTRYRRWLANA